MAKKKKKGKKHQTFYRAVKPYIKDNRVLLALLGAVGAGVALGKALGPDKAGGLVDGISAAVRHLTHHHHTGDAEEKSKHSKKDRAPKEESHGKQFAIENV
ncbi:hypothetical protein [Rufibacter tibetensis]|uniref:Uncharacterized protein n=1 Tax=Rufibacter tibetensis TaxID=512763 RepID=A0A0P0CVD7_9BACT|nr:hypothetical protein [Rufibacter tibetensis]ALI98342.1 hypothetical protein DC20_04275 [Rufibacter tibetensis]